MSSAIKKWDNDVYQWDVTTASRELNPWLKNFGKDRLTYEPESTYTDTAREFYVEGPRSHGYPATAWLQLGLVYAAGLYTAKEQGIVKKGVYFQRFWRAHYFDWLLFARRAGIYGIAGGLLIGTRFLGNPHVALLRVYSKYYYYFAMETTDPRNRDTTHFTKF